jgi:hypothetical protein
LVIIFYINNFHIYILEYIFPSKLEAFYSFEKNIPEMSNLIGESTSSSNFGIFAIINRYGIIGFVTIIFIIFAVIFYSLKIITSKNSTFRSIFGASSVIATGLISLKIPQINPMMMFILFYGFICLNPNLVIKNLKF